MKVEGFIGPSKPPSRVKAEAGVKQVERKKLRLHIVLLHARIGSRPLLEPMGCHPPPPMRILNTASCLMMSS